MKGDMERIRQAYGVPARRFMRVRFKGDLYDANEGVITGAGKSTIRVRVQHFGANKIVNFAPGDLQYLPEGAK